MTERQRSTRKAWRKACVDYRNARKGERDRTAVLLKKAATEILKADIVAARERQERRTA